MKALFTCLLTLLLLGGTACNRSPFSYVEQGEKLFAEGKYEDASLNYKKAIQKDAKYGEAYYKLGLSELKQNKVREAYSALSQASDILPNREDIAVALADVCLSEYAGRDRKSPALYERLTKISSRLLEKDPSSYQGLRIRGQILILDNKAAEAVATLRKANEIKPNQPETVMSLTHSLVMNNQGPEAESLALEFLRERKDFAPLYDVLYTYYLSVNRLGDAENTLISMVANVPKQPEPVLQLAQFYAQHKKTAEMKATLQKLTDDPATFPLAPRQVGDFYNGIGDQNEALKLYEAGATSNSKEKSSYQKRIVGIYVQQGKLDKATELTDSILKENPQDEDSLFMRPFLMVQSKDPVKLAKAVEEFQPLVKKKPNDAILRYTLGQAYGLTGNPQAAEKEYQEAIKISAGAAGPRIALSALYLDQDRYKESINEADAVLKFQPDNTRAQYLRAASMIGTGNYKEARVMMNSLIKEHPQEPEFQMQIGFLDVFEKKYAEAEAIFRRHYKPGNANLRALKGLVELYGAQRRFDQAMQVLNDDLKLSTNPTGVRAILASMASRAGNVMLAVQQYRQLASTQPNSAQMQLLLGQAQIRAGQPQEAVISLQKATTLAPTSGEPLMPLAVALESSNRKDEAKQTYRRILTMESDNAYALNNLAYLLAETGGDLEEASRLAERAVKKVPDQPNFADTLGWVFLKKNMNDSSMQVFRNLVKKYPDNPTFHYHLGIVLLKTGDKQAAKAEFEKALTQRPSAETADKIKQSLASMG